MNEIKDKLIIFCLSLIINVFIVIYSFIYLSNSLITVIMPLASFLINIFTYKFTEVYKSFAYTTCIHLYLLISIFFNFDEYPNSLFSIISGIIILSYLLIGIFESTQGYYHQKGILSIFRPFKTSK